MFDIFGPGAITGATVGGFVFGAVWYGVLGKAWMRSADLPEEQTKPSPSIMIITLMCQIVLALAMAGVMWHTGVSSVRGGVITGVLIWGGFILPTMIVNHRFQGRPWSLTLIDTGSWLGILLLQGVLLGWLSD